MSMKRQIITYTTAADGSATAYAPSPNTILGELYAIHYRPGTTDTGATVTVTCESDSSKPLLTKATAGTSNAWFYPRDLVHAVLDGAALTGTSGGDRCKPLINGKLRLVVASGGNATTGSVVIYYED